MTTGAQGRLVEVESVEPSVLERAPVGAAKRLRAYDQGQVLLMAPSIQDWVPDGHLARFVSDLVDEALDLSAIYGAYEEERGFAPYDPRLMVKLLIYGYATGTPSSRKLEERTFSDVAVRFLCADQHPDFRPIARFRKRHVEALSGLFVQALRLCRQAGLVGLGTLALDGTKLRANASRHKAMSYERMVSKEAQLEAEIAVIGANARALLDDAERVDAAEDERLGADRRGDELPEDLRRREDRLARIREAKRALEDQARAAETARRAEMTAQAKTPRKPPNGRDPFAPKPKAQRNFTDPDSKIMKTADGSFHQCFNGQAVVDSQTQVIVACELSDQAPDAEQLEPALDRLAENLAAVEARLPEGAALVADAGYFCEHNILVTAAHGLDAHIATGKTRHDDPAPVAPKGPIPKHATPKQRMQRKLMTKNGHAVYKQRKTIVEPVFGQLDTVQDARQLLLRGTPAARAQWAFNCTIHNLLKLYRNGGLPLIATG
jgi:transposase